MGDVMYALPVLRALARLHETKIHLTTSGLCWQMVPLLLEQPYFEDVVVDDTRPYGLKSGVSSNWEFYKPDEGINLSLQPRYYDLDMPISWTMAAARLAGVDTLAPADCVALPSMVNHHRWYHSITMSLDGRPVQESPSVVLAPEVESLEPAPWGTWCNIAGAMASRGWRVIVIGRRRSEQMWPDDVYDLRGATTVASMARIIAEATVFIGAHSFPWHLARHSEVPAVCVQGWREGLRRCIPVDTAPERAPWVEPDQWESAYEWALHQGGMCEQPGGA